MEIEKHMDDILCTLKDSGLVRNTQPFNDLVSRTTGSEASFKELAVILESDNYICFT